MGSRSGTIPNVIGGISQQPPAARLENTAEDLMNAIPSVVSGNRKRPPMRFVSNLMAAPASSVAVYELLRPAQNTKFITIADDTLKAFDQTGAEEPVTITGSAAAYITEADPETNLGFFSIADSVFVYNKTKTVGTIHTTETRPDPQDQITAVIENTNGNATFKLTISDGVTTQVGSHTTSSTNPPAPDTLAQTVVDDFNASGSLVATRKGNVITVTGVAGYDTFSMEPASLTHIYKDVTEKFSKLPLYENDGRIVKIAGDPTSERDAYYVSYDASKRLWSEDVGYDAKDKLDPATMPHLLVDNGDGTWELKPFDWTERGSGDTESNPNPSFVGFTINSMFAASDRLCILSDENIIASETSEYGTFYRTTNTTLVDSDRMDLAALTPDSRVNILYHAVDFDERIFLFSDEAQFSMEFGDGLSPNTTSIRPSTKFKAAALARPVRLDANVLFVDDARNSSWADMRELLIDSVVGTSGSDIITKQVPELIPSGVHKIVPNTTLGLALVFSKGRRDRIYVYSTFYSNNERVQSAWCYWEDANVQFLSAAFDGNRAYMTFLRNGQLESAEIDLQETLSGDVGGLEVQLDYRVDTPSATFDGTDTTVTLPYDTLPGEGYVLVLTADGIDKAGTAYEASSTAGNTVVFSGLDLSAETFLIGKRYSYIYHLSPIFLRDRGNVPIQDGRLQLRYISILYHRSSYFRVEVTPPGRNTFTSVFTGRTLGRLTNVVGEVAVDDGEFRVAVFTEASNAHIRIINDSPFNCRFSSIEWEGSWRPKTKRMR